MKNRKRKKSGRVIAVLLFLILAAAIVLAAVWFGVLKDVILPPSTEQASVDTAEAVPAEQILLPVILHLQNRLLNPPLSLQLNRLRSL